MAWFTLLDGLKTKVCRYLLQRYLGQFLEEKLNLEQLNIELYNGKATVQNVGLNCKALNELFETNGLNVEVTSGYIDCVTVSVPWNALMTDDSDIQVSNMQIVLRPILRKTTGLSMFESLWSSMSSSMQMAQECLKDDFDEDGYGSQLNAQNTYIDGLEKFAQTIDNVLRRIKATFSNIEIRLEHEISDGRRGVALAVLIEKLNYQNAACSDRDDETAEGVDKFETHSNSNRKTNLSSHSIYNITLNEITINTEEFEVPQHRNLPDTQSHKLLEQTHETENTLLYNHDGEKVKCLEKDVPEDGRIISPQYIPVFRIEGKQNVRIKVNQLENTRDPRVSLDVQLGAVFAFLTPRQIHLFGIFYNIFFNELVSNVQYDELREKDKDKLKLNTNNPSSNMTGIIPNQEHWIDPREDFYSTTHVTNENEQSNEKSYDYCETISSSLTSSSTTTPLTFRRNLDFDVEVSSFTFRIANINCIILYDDILSESSEICGHPLSEESVTKMKHVVNQFLYTFDENVMDDSLSKNNHLKLHLSPIIVDGIHERSANLVVIKSSVSVTKSELKEVLDSISTSLIAFDRSENSSNGFHKRPEITVNFKVTTSTNMNEERKPREKAKSRTAINVILEKVCIDFDISIYDRLSALLTASPYKSDLHSMSQFSHCYEGNIDLDIESPCTEVRLRFPIADCRPTHDPNRKPWWKQNIHPDFLLFMFCEFQLKLVSSNVDITAKEIDVYYCESVSSPKIQIAKINVATNTGLTPNESHVAYPRISIEIPAEINLMTTVKYLSESSRVCGDTSDEGCNSYVRKSRSSLPFSSNRICRESDTPHARNDDDETETVILPSDATEMNRFCDDNMISSQIQIKLFLPAANVHIVSKHVYETIYNRISTDLLMWEPSSPMFPTMRKPEQLIDQNLSNIGLVESIYIPYKNEDKCFLENNTDFQESSSESDLEASSIYYSTCERKDLNKKRSTLSVNRCSFELNISEAIITLLSPVRDSENRVLPGQLGEIYLRTKSLKLFFVNGFNGDDCLSYMCMQSKLAEMFHCGLTPSNRGPTLLFSTVSCTPPNYMQPTFYPTPMGLTKCDFLGESSYKREMISLAIEIKKVPSQRIKRIKLTAGIQKATIRHNPAISQHIWLNQLMDFVDVLDYPIEGFKPYGVVTEMQLHLWDCSADYRPTNYAYRVIVEINTFMLSSNIISSISGCTLRFISEDFILSLAPFDPSDNLSKQNENLLPSSDLVPVLDVGLLDISLRLNGKENILCPQLDLRASIQDVHIRTCSDSGQAFAQLISYLAADGDFVECDDVTGNLGSSTSSSIYSDAQLLSLNKSQNDTPEISPEQQQRVNLLMAEAVQETVTSTRSANHESISELNLKKGVEVYFFPDETIKAKCVQKKNKSYGQHCLSETENKFNLHTTTNSSPSDEWEFNHPLETERNNEFKDLLYFESSIMNRSYKAENESAEAMTDNQELERVRHLSVSNSRKNSLDVNNDFFVIPDEEKLSTSQCGIKNMNISEEPLRIVDNHFPVPSGKEDLLKAPQNFPVAENRYTLCEMTFTWHMYGGHDFPLKCKKKESKENENRSQKRTQMSEAYKHGVLYSKAGESLNFGRKTVEKISSKTRGGSSRNHNVLIEIQLTKVRVSHETYPNHTIQASRQVLIISELEIRDRLQTSEINKLLYHPKARHLPHKISQHMIVIKALHIRPDPHCKKIQECSLRISLLPLRLNIDQDALLFLVQFFSELSGDLSFPSNGNGGSTGSPASNQSHAPKMMVDEMPQSLQDYKARQMITTNLDLLMEGNTSCNMDGRGSDIGSSGNEMDRQSPIFFREIIFSPDVLIRLDYHGRRIEMSRGPIAGLLMGLGQLQCSEIRLKKIAYKHGISGVDKLLTYLFKEWLQDIKKSQLPAILSGVGPTYTFIQLFQGIRDLFWLPIEQYQKDGRIAHGLQLGAQSFTARTALAALEITSRIIQLLQITAETAFDMVSPGPSISHGRLNCKGKRKRPHHPQDIREGVASACQIVKEGINKTANTLYETAITEHDQKGYTGAVGAVFRQIPPIVVCPVVLATQATTNILSGVKSQLVPDAKLEAREKWKEDND